MGMGITALEPIRIKAAAQRQRWCHSRGISLSWCPLITAEAGG